MMLGRGAAISVFLLQNVVANPIPANKVKVEILIIMV